MIFMKKSRRRLVFGILAFLVFAGAVSAGGYYWYWFRNVPAEKQVFYGVIDKVYVRDDGTVTALDATKSKIIRKGITYPSTEAVGVLLQDETKFRTQNGKKLTAADLKAGQQIKATVSDSVIYEPYDTHWHCYKIVVLDPE